MIDGDQGGSQKWIVTFPGPQMVGWPLLGKESTPQKNSEYFHFKEYFD